MRRHVSYCLLTVLALIGSGCETTHRSVAPVYTDSADGWRLALRHYEPKEAKPDKPPVILCHGLGLNSYFWNLDESVNFPGYLADHGYDVWTLDLRSYGQSRLANRFTDYVSPDIAGNEDPYSSFSIDDYVKYDIPAAIKEVRKQTGADAVTWIGHSMGGMIMYAYLEVGERPEDIKNFVSIGSPLICAQPPSDLLVDLAELGEKLQDFNTKNFVRPLAGIVPLMNSPLDVLYYNKDNSKYSTIVRMYSRSYEDFPQGVTKQLDIMRERTSFFSEDGSFNYTDNLKRITTPILMLSAKADNMAPPISVLAAFYRVSSKDKTYRMFGRANKYSVDYGHCDVITGVNARKEVYPYILNWLDEH